MGLKLELLICDVLINGSANKAIKTKAIAATPPNLLGILRRIA